MKWVERQKHFIDFILSSLLRRKGKNSALLLVYTLVIFMVASVIFFSQALRREAEILLQDAPEMTVQRLVAGRHDLIPLEYLETIKQIRGVQSAKGRLWGYYFHPASRSNYTVMVPDDFRHHDQETEVGSGVMRTWGTAEDHTLYFKAYNGEVIILEVVSTFDDAVDLVASDLILTSESTFRKLFGVREGYATDLVVSISNKSECQTIAEKILQALPDTRPILREEILRTYASLFDWRSGYVIVLLSGAVLAFFIFAWDKATGLSAEEKKEIGILKALGWDTSDVLMIKFWEGIAVSLTAFLVGVSAAYVHVFVASAPIFEYALKGWAVLYPSFKLTPSVSLYHLMVLFFLTVVPYTLMTIVPSWKVAITDPDAIMRQG